MSTNDSHESLKVCPFCGGEARTSRSHCTVSGQLKWELFATVHECPIVGDLRTINFDTEEAAIEAWNTRHMTPCETCPQTDNPDSFIFHLLQAERRANDAD